MTAVQQVRVDDLIQDKAMQVRSYRDDRVVNRYVTCFDDLPPVEVVDAPEGKLLADGVHRVGAAKRLGRTHIAANVREGTREDAEVIALLANTTHGQPLEHYERENAVLRLHELRPDWSKRELARRLAVSEGTVRNLLKDQKIRVELKQAGVSQADGLNATVRAQIYAAPPELRPDLATAASSKRWTAEQARAMIQVMTDPQLPEADKRLALAGMLPKPRTPAQEEEEERLRQEKEHRLLFLDPFNTRGQSPGPSISFDPFNTRGRSPDPSINTLRRGASGAMCEILDKLLRHDPRGLAQAIDAHERAVWTQYIQRIRRWVDDFEEAADAENWVVDDLP